jgi:hypothetical protein
MSQEEHNRQIHDLDRKMKGHRTAPNERPKTCAAPGSHQLSLRPSTAIRRRRRSTLRCRRRAVAGEASRKGHPRAARALAENPDATRDIWPSAARVALC